MLTISTAVVGADLDITIVSKYTKVIKLIGEPVKSKIPYFVLLLYYILYYVLYYFTTRLIFFASKLRVSLLKIDKATTLFVRFSL